MHSSDLGKETHKKESNVTAYNSFRVLIIVGARVLGTAPHATAPPTLIIVGPGYEGWDRVLLPHP